MSLCECVSLCLRLSVSVFYNTHCLEFGGRPKKTSNEKKADLKRLSRKLNDDVEFAIWCLSDQLLKSTREIHTSIKNREFQSIKFANIVRI